MRLQSKLWLDLFFWSFSCRLPGAFAAGDLKATLAKLDAAAARFKSTAADFEFDSVQTDPIPDTDVQKGTPTTSARAAHSRWRHTSTEVNGKKAPKVYVYSGGKLKLYEPMINQVTTLAKVSQYESYLMLGFGASGKDLADKWDITDDGTEAINGVKTEKLELVAKDPDRAQEPAQGDRLDRSDRGVSLKQYFDEGQGQSRTCLYTNIKINESLPGDAFTFKTDSKTQYINR